eukprot:2170511-Pyramimonas_sp.AAC.1
MVPRTKSASVYKHRSTHRAGYKIGTTRINQHPFDQVLSLETTAHRGTLPLLMAPPLFFRLRRIVASQGAVPMQANTGLAGAATRSARVRRSRVNLIPPGCAVSLEMMAY